MSDVSTLAKFQLNDISTELKTTLIGFIYD
jgi:hypothetical protein